MSNSVRQKLAETLNSLASVNDPIEGHLDDSRRSPVHPDHERWTAIELIGEFGSDGPLRSSEYLYLGHDGEQVPVALVIDERNGIPPTGRLYYGIKSIVGGDEDTYPLRSQFLADDPTIPREGTFGTYMRGIALSDIDMLTSAWHPDVKFFAPWVPQNAPWDFATIKPLFQRELDDREADPELRHHREGMGLASLIVDGDMRIIEFNVPYTRPVSAGYARYVFAPDGGTMTELRVYE